MPQCAQAYTKVKGDKFSGALNFTLMDGERSKLDLLKEVIRKSNCQIDKC